MSRLSLKPLPGAAVPSKRLVLNVILDGIAIAPHSTGNAVRHAQTPCLDKLFATCPHRTLYAHGEHVGMPSPTDMGNSEVGHNAIGAGRIFAQGAKLVRKAIETGALYTEAPWQELMATLQTRDAALHFIGLLSDGNVHSHIAHIQSLLEHAAAAGQKKIYLHVLTDGRDTAPQAANQYIEQIEAVFSEIRARHAACDARIVSVSGRMVTFMDRYEANWDMIERGWALTVEGKGPHFPSARAGIEHFRPSHPNDQFIPSFLVTNTEQPLTTIEEGDGVICCNFRGDRAIELSQIFENRSPIEDRKQKHISVEYLGITLYDADTQTPSRYLVSPPSIDRTMGEYLVGSDCRLFAVSETQKYGHVTYFWNGNHSEPFDAKLETYEEIKNADRPFEETPWMKAAEVTDAAIALIRSGKYHFGRINYPNGDMVGHTGDFRAAVLSVEAVDLCLQRLLDVVAEVGGIAIITADHGNCDEMIALDPKTGEAKRDANGAPVPKTSHTLQPVPFIIYDPDSLAGNGKSTGAANTPPYTLKGNETLPEAGIAHIAATTLMLMGYVPPEDYLESLITFTGA